MYFLEKKNKDVWNYILIGNAAVLAAAGILFGWDKALYSIIFQFASTEMIKILYQAHNKVTLFIVTDYPNEIYRVILEKTNHSATEIPATGMYSHSDRTMLYCVVSSTEAKIVTRCVIEKDSKALVNVVKTEMFIGRFYRPRNY